MNIRKVELHTSEISGVPTYHVWRLSMVRGSVWIPADTAAYQFLSLPDAMAFAQRWLEGHAE